MNHKSKCGRRSLPVSQWPKADQAGWRRALQPQDFLDDTIGYASRWKPSTRTLTESATVIGSIGSPEPAR